MTINTATSKTIVLGNGAQTQFAFGFIGVAAAYISAILTDSAGNETPLTQGAGATKFQVSLNDPVEGALWGVGGTVTYDPSGTPIPAGSSLTVFRTLPLTQAISLQHQASLQTMGDGAETGLDTGVMQLQQVFENISRAIVAPIVDPAAPLPLPPAAQRANHGAAFDGEGNMIAGVLPATGVISSAMQPVVNAASLALGRQALGLGNVAVENVGKGLTDDGSGNLQVRFEVFEVAANQNIVKSSHTNVYMCGVALSFTLARANTLFNDFCFTVYALAGSVTLTPDANDNFFGLASGAAYIVPQGSVALFTTDAAASGIWYVELVPVSQPLPGGYLTPQSGTPVILGDVTSGTLFYAPDVHGYVPIYNGVSPVVYPFQELSASLATGYAAGAPAAFDWFITLVAGVVTLVSGPIWRNGGQAITGASNATPIVITANNHNLSTGDDPVISGVIGNSAANGKWTITRVDANNFSLNGSVGSGAYTAGTGQFAARGVGAGTTQLSRVANGGFRTNAVSMTARNGASTFTVPANQATFVGSILMDVSGNTVTCHRSFGQARIWSIFNAFNRKPIFLKGGDPGSWSYTTNAIRPAHGNTANSLSLFVGLAEEVLDLNNSILVGSGLINNQSTGGQCGIGFNSITQYSGRTGEYSFTNSSGGSVTVSTEVLGEFNAPPGLGLMTITALESGLGVTANTWTASEAFMLLSAEWRG